MRKRSSIVVLVAVSITSSLAWAQPSPWVDRADAVATNMLRGPSGVAVAQSIQGITHPSGKNAILTAFDIRHVGESLSVRLTVDWAGALGTSHTTVVVWDFNRFAHRSATVLGDNAAFAVAAKNARQLNEYFRDEMYPILRNRLGD